MSRTKLTVEQAMEIRRRFENLGPGGSGLTSLAVQFHAAKDTIYRILTGEHWLVRGAPDISQARKAGPEGVGTDWRTGVSDRQRKLVTGGAPRMSAQQYRIRNACPTCGARRGEYCVRIGGTYQRPIKTVHDERKR